MILIPTSPTANITLTQNFHELLYATYSCFYLLRVMENRGSEWPEVAVRMSCPKANTAADEPLLRRGKSHPLPKNEMESKSPKKPHTTSAWAIWMAWSQLSPY
jgi:hypothetical protein